MDMCTLQTLQTMAEPDCDHVEDNLLPVLVENEENQPNSEAVEVTSVLAGLDWDDYSDLN